MTSYATRIRALFDDIDRTPWGPEERALVAEAVALAQESGDERLEYEARLRQTSSANMAGDTDLMLTSFAWCLAHHDGDPERFPAVLEPAGDLLWQYKWMAGALSNSPEFAPAQIAAVLDDMHEHYRRAGVGESGVLMARFEDAWSAGRVEEATALQRTLEATPRDDYSHCDACVRSQFAGFFAETGREDDAIRLVQEMIDGGFSCGEEPEHALARILLPYLRAGMLDQARGRAPTPTRWSPPAPPQPCSPSPATPAEPTACGCWRPTPSLPTATRLAAPACWTRCCTTRSSRTAVACACSRRGLGSTASPRSSPTVRPPPMRRHGSRCRSAWTTRWSRRCSCWRPCCTRTTDSRPPQ